jgi:hypothetical protein
LGIARKVDNLVKLVRTYEDFKIRKEGRKEESNSPQKNALKEQNAEMIPQTQEIRKPAIASSSKPLIKNSSKLAVFRDSEEAPCQEILFPPQTKTWTDYDTSKIAKENSEVKADQWKGAIIPSKASTSTVKLNVFRDEEVFNSI